ncbi:MAG: DNA translocase FtsK 4TM domain-containing protein [Raoultibacter sp.]
MAQKSSVASKKKSKPAASKKQVASPAEKDSRKKKVAASARDDGARIMDERTKRDIGGLVLAICSIVLFIVAVLPSDALVTSWVSSALHLCLGIGAYILPFVLLVIAGSFFIRFDRQPVTARVAIGLAIIFVALLALLALFTPISPQQDFVVVFNPEHLVSRGGYIGAGIAWVGLTLFGQVVSAVILVGLIIVGLVVIGFSVSKLIEKMLSHKELDDEDQTSVFDSPAFARVKRSDAQKQPAEASGITSVLPKSGTKKPRRASSSLKTQVIGTIPNQYDSPQVQEKAMTRKLGKKNAQSEQASTTASPDKPSANTAVLATPKAQEGFELPKPEMLQRSRSKAKGGASEGELKDTAACLQETLEDFNISAQVVGWVAGPTVTLFKVDLPAGVRVSRITALEDDIALALAAPGVRIFAPIPGTNYVGIEVPNKQRNTVLLGDVISKAGAGPLEIAIGMDVEGTEIISDLAKMPHLLIGGTTGSGKSVSINAMIMSILMRATPAEVRFIMIDPKRVELTPYNGIPHLYVPVVTEPREAASALSWGVAEMERRLKVFSKVGARNIGQYNAKVQQGSLEDEEAHDMPYIVIIIDELADLMMNVGKEVEYSISRIAQLARAAGIHLIVATQRPSTNVVTGLIKANITNRIAFNVASGIDSRVVLDTPGAENLIGLGDLLLSKPEFAKPQRIQGCYVSEDEINSVVEFLKAQGEPEYHSEILKTNLISIGSSSPDGNGGGSSDDPLIWEAAEITVSSGLGSTSNIQRRLKVGYSRAGRIMDMLEEKGIVGPPNGSKPREVLVDLLELETLKAFEQQDEDGSHPSMGE